MLATKNIIKRTTTAILLTITCYSVQAKPVMTITCSEPNGSRTDFYAGEFKDSKDGFAGVTIKVFFDSKKAQQTSVHYDPADLAKAIGIKKPNSVFKIVDQNTDKITMISQISPNVVHLYSLYPKLGVGNFTVHRYNKVGNGEASIGTFVGKCKVAAQ